MHPTIFIITTLATQFELAIKARTNQNFEYVLFDTDKSQWNDHNIVRVGNIVIKISDKGERGILSTGAQKAFTRVKEYLDYLSTDSLALVRVTDTQVILKKINDELEKCVCTGGN